MWQPIETAPKDGCYVDLWIPAFGMVKAYRLANARWYNGDWVTTLGWDGFPPTHWMPMPDPPET